MKYRISRYILLLFLTFTFSTNLAYSQVASEKVNTIKITSIKYSKGKTNIIYPQISNIKDKKIESKINSTLKNKAFSFVDTSNPDTTYHGEYKIKYNKNNLLSILFVQDIYHKGAVHNYYQYSSITINLSSGNVCRLKDIYISNKNYKSDIEKIINKQAAERIAQKKLYLLSDEAIQINEDQFYVADQYIIIYFNPYEIAAFSEGIIEFNVNKTLSSSITTSKVPRIIDKAALSKIFTLNQSDIRKLYGTPDDRGTFEGAYYESYNKDNITFFFELSSKDNQKLISVGFTEDYIVLGTQAGMSTDQVKKVLGKPKWEGESFEDETYYVSYNLYGHEITYALDDTHTNIAFIQIKPLN